MKRFLSVCLLFTTVHSLPAENWPQFRGPDAAGRSPEAVPLSWSDTENLLWKTELPGPGSSSPIVHGDAVFVTAYSGTAPEVTRHLLRIDRDSGEVVWEKTVPTWHPEDPGQGFITEHGWASNTPVTDGERVYGYFGKAGVHAFDFDGNRLWKAETGSRSSSKRWGSAASPILYKDLVIVPAGDEARTLFALKQSTGEVAWEAPGDRLEQTYGTPVLMKVDASRTDLVYAITGEIWGLNPDTGKLRWWAEYNLPGNMSNTVALSGDLITISGGYPRTARVALPGGGKGDRSSEILYDVTKPATYMTAPVLLDGVFYWISDSGIAFAAEPGQGVPLWQERVPGLDGAGGRGKPFYASPVAANGTIYAMSRANGTFVIEPSRDGLSVLHQNRFAGDATLFNATPAVSDGKLFLRSQTHLYGVGKE